MLMVVSPKLYLYRLIEYKLFELEPKLKFVRTNLTEIYQKAKLDDLNKLF